MTGSCVRCPVRRVENGEVQYWVKWQNFDSSENSEPPPNAARVSTHTIG